eukprot:jgi/Mesvir1/27545/Mv24203-RA.1
MKPSPPPQPPQPPPAPPPKPPLPPAPPGCYCRTGEIAKKTLDGACTCTTPAFLATLFANGTALNPLNKAVFEDYNTTLEDAFTASYAASLGGPSGTQVEVLLAQNVRDYLLQAGASVPRPPGVDLSRGGVVIQATAIGPDDEYGMVQLLAHPDMKAVVASMAAGKTLGEPWGFVILLDVTYLGPSPPPPPTPPGPPPPVPPVPPPPPECFCDEDEAEVVFTGGRCECFPPNIIVGLHCSGNYSDFTNQTQAFRDELARALGVNTYQVLLMGSREGSILVNFTYPQCPPPRPSAARRPRPPPPLMRPPPRIAPPPYPPIPPVSAVDATAPAVTFQLKPLEETNALNPVILFRSADPPHRPWDCPYCTYSCLLDNRAVGVACEAGQAFVLPAATAGAHVFSLKVTDAKRNARTYTLRWKTDVTRPRTTLLTESVTPVTVSNLRPWPLLVEFDRECVQWKCPESYAMLASCQRIAPMDWMWLDIDGTADGYIDFDAPVPAVQQMTATRFRVNVTPTRDGTLQVSVPAGVCVDRFGNQNEASSRLNLRFDATPPTVLDLSTDDLDVVTVSVNGTDKLAFSTTRAPIRFRLEFSEPMAASCTASSIGILSGSGGVKAFAHQAAVSGSSSGSSSASRAVYTFDIEPAEDSRFVVQVLPGGTGGSACRDLAGNPVVASPPIIFVYDGTRPSVAVSSLQGATASLATFLFDFQFSEVVFDFDQSDLIVENGNLTTFVNRDRGYYVLEVVPDTEAFVRVSLAESVGTDLAGNPSTASNVAVCQHYIKSELVESAVGTASTAVGATLAAAGASAVAAAAGSGVGGGIAGGAVGGAAGASMVYVAGHMQALQQLNGLNTPMDSPLRQLTHSMSWMNFQFPMPFDIRPRGGERNITTDYNVTDVTNNPEFLVLDRPNVTTAGTGTGTGGTGGSSRRRLREPVTDAGKRRGSVTSPGIHRSKLFGFAVGTAASMNPALERAGASRRAVGEGAGAYQEGDSGDGVDAGADAGMGTDNPAYEAEGADETYFEGEGADADDSSENTLVRVRRHRRVLFGPGEARVTRTPSQLMVVHRRQLADTGSNGSSAVNVTAVEEEKSLTVLELERLSELSSSGKEGRISSSLESSLSDFTTWSDFLIVMFWLSVEFVGLTTAHYIFHRVWPRIMKDRPVPEFLEFPRFELFLIVLAIPAVTRAGAYSISLNTTGTIVAGVFVLVFFPLAFLAFTVFFIVAKLFGGKIVFDTKDEDEAAAPADPATPAAGAAHRSGDETPAAADEERALTLTPQQRMRRAVRKVQAQNQAAATPLAGGKLAGVVTAILGRTREGEWASNEGEKDWVAKYGLLFEDFSGPRKATSAIARARMVSRWKRKAHVGTGPSAGFSGPAGGSGGWSPTGTGSGASVESTVTFGSSSSQQPLSPEVDPEVAHARDDGAHKGFDEVDNTKEVGGGGDRVLIDRGGVFITSAHARASYFLVVIMKECLFAFLMGIWSDGSHGLTQTCTLAGWLVFHFVYLFAFKPFSDRVTQQIEQFSLLCELGTLICSAMLLILHAENDPRLRRRLTRAMMFLAGGSTAVQLFNQWYDIFGTARELVPKIYHKARPYLFCLPARFRRSPVAIAVHDSNQPDSPRSDDSTGGLGNLNSPLGVAHGSTFDPWAESPRSESTPTAAASSPRKSRFLTTLLEAKKVQQAPTLAFQPAQGPSSGMLASQGSVGSGSSGSSLLPRTQSSETKPPLVAISPSLPYGTGAESAPGHRNSQAEEATAAGMEPIGVPPHMPPIKVPPLTMPSLALTVSASFGVAGGNTRPTTPSAIDLLDMTWGEASLPTGQQPQTQEDLQQGQQGFASSLGHVRTAQGTVSRPGSRRVTLATDGSSLPGSLLDFAAGAGDDDEYDGREARDRDREKESNNKNSAGATAGELGQDDLDAYIVEDQTPWAPVDEVIAGARDSPPSAWARGPSGVPRAPASDHEFPDIPAVGARPVSASARGMVRKLVSRGIVQGPWGTGGGDADGASFARGGALGGGFGEPAGEGGHGHGGPAWAGMHHDGEGTGMGGQSNTALPLQLSTMAVSLSPRAGRVSSPRRYSSKVMVMESGSPRHRPPSGVRLDRRSSEPGGWVEMEAAGPSGARPGAPSLIVFSDSSAASSPRDGGQ